MIFIRSDIANSHCLSLSIQLQGIWMGALRLIKKDRYSVPSRQSPHERRGMWDIAGGGAPACRFAHAGYGGAIGGGARGPPPRPSPARGEGA
jgi:hypothetical protein